MTLFNNFCAAILAVASACRTAIKDAARIIFGFFAAEANAAVGFLPTIRRMKSATAFLAVAVAIPLMSACGGGGSSGGTDLNSPRGPGTAEGDSSVGSISRTTVTENVALASAMTITQPMASAVATISVDFTNADGTGEDLVFPVGSVTVRTLESDAGTTMVDVNSRALIRSADGNDYALINHQNSFAITTTITVAAVPPTSYNLDGASFTYQAPSGRCSGGVDPVSSTMICTSTGIWTFMSVTAAISATITFSGVPFSEIFAGLSTAETRTIMPDGDSPRTFTPVTTTISPIHVWEFETGQTNSEVASVVAAFQTKVTAAAESDLVRAVVTVTVKGARDRVNRSRPSDNQNIRYSVDAYIFETQYSALGLWIEDPREFFGLSTVAWDPDVSESGVFHFGLQTPTGGVPNTGTARYTGIAAGRYLRNRGERAEDRFSVSGVVNLEADFTDNGGITGTAALTAYAVADLATSEGEVTVQLTDGTFGTGDDRATFSGVTSISPDSAAGDFRALERGVDGTPVDGTGGFEGYFTGPGADRARPEEAVGRATFESNSGANSLEFGFLTQQATSPDRN